jgi:hypothetical protein
VMWDALIGQDHHLVDVAPLRAFQRAGNAVYETLDDAEQLRQKLQASGADAWRYSPAQSAALLCTWNAYVLQTIGESLLAGAVRQPGSGQTLLAKPCFDQAWLVFAQVEPWVGCAQRALTDPAYALNPQRLPADLPGWVDDLAPASYLRSLLDAADAVGGRADVAVADVLTDDAATREPADVARIRGLMAQAASIGDYARTLVDPHTGQHLRVQVQDRLHLAMTVWFQVGQLLAMPTLLGSYHDPGTALLSPSAATAPPQRSAPHQTFEAAVIDAAATLAATSGSRVSAAVTRAFITDGVGSIDRGLPDESRYVSAGWDPWCFTEPSRQVTAATDEHCLQQLHHLWQMDPTPGVTAALAQQLRVAVASGALRVALDATGRPLSLDACPWPAVYDVVEPVVLTGRLMRVGSQVTVQVGLAADGRFHCDVVPTS